MQMGRYAFGMICGGGICLSAVAWGAVQPGQAQEPDLQELYNLCSRFPFNSQCEGYEIPIPLDNQPGTLVGCGLELNSPASSERCRVAVDGETLTLYYEVGDLEELLDDRRASEAIAIPLSHLFTADLRIWRRGQDATSFFAGGSLYVLRDEDYQGFERDFDPTTDDDERGGFGDRDFAEVEIGFVTEASGDGNRTNILQITATEEFGAYLIGQLAPQLPDVRTNPLLADLSLTAAGEVDPSLQAQQLEQLREDGACVRCDLREADLREFDLEDANLEGADLTGANLTGVDLEDVYLVAARLDGAILTDADLSGGRITLASVVEADLTRADLNVVNFQQANLQGATLTEATLGGANLEWANLAGADLSGADLTHFTATGFIPFLGLNRFKLYTTLRQVNGEGANFQGADLENTRLDNASLRLANFTDANLDDTDFSGATLTEAVTGDADFAVAYLCNTTLPDGTLSNQNCETAEN